MKTHRNKSFVLLFAMISFVILNSCEVADDLLGENETVAELEGEWIVDEDSELYDKSTRQLMAVYNVTISADPGNPNGIIIHDFYQVEIDVKANISGNQLSISNYSESGFVVNGSGAISNNRQVITMSYTVSDSGGAPDHCTAIYTKGD
jgi:hypothetical protein